MNEEDIRRIVRAEIAKGIFGVGVLIAFQSFVLVMVIAYAL